MPRYLVDCSQDISCGTTLAYYDSNLKYVDSITSFHIKATNRQDCFLGYRKVLEIANHNGGLKPEPVPMRKLPVNYSKMLVHFRVTDLYIYDNHMEIRGSLGILPSIPNPKLEIILKTLGISKADASEIFNLVEKHRKTGGGRVFLTISGTPAKYNPQVLRKDTAIGGVVKSWATKFQRILYPQENIYMSVGSVLKVGIELGDKPFKFEYKFNIDKNGVALEGAGSLVQTANHWRYGLGMPASPSGTVEVEVRAILNGLFAGFIADLHYKFGRI